MNIDVSYIIVALLSSSIGSWIGFICGFKLGRAKIYNMLLETKNPELWELGHFAKIEEKEQTKQRAKEKRCNSK